MILIPNVGQLDLDCILFGDSSPILFTCLDNNKNLYLCLQCYEDNSSGKWLATSVSPNTIIDMLENKVTLRDSFLINKEDIYTIIYNYRTQKFIYKINDEDDYNTCLPVPGEYMDSEEDEFSEEIEHFKSMIGIDRYML